MSAIIAMLPENARKTHSALLQALARVGLDPISQELGVSASTVSRMKKDDEAIKWDIKFSQVALLLHAMGLKAVPQSYKCYSTKKVDWLIVGAREYAATLQSAADLPEEDPE